MGWYKIWSFQPLSCVLDIEPLYSVNCLLSFPCCFMCDTVFWYVLLLYRNMSPRSPEVYSSMIRISLSTDGKAALPILATRAYCYLQQRLWERCLQHFRVLCKARALLGLNKTWGSTRPENTLFYIAGLMQFQGSRRPEIQWSLRMLQILHKSVISGLVEPQVSFSPKSARALHKTRKCWSHFPSSLTPSRC